MHSKKSKVSKQGRVVRQKTPTSTIVAVVTAVMTGLGTIVTHWQGDSDLKVKVATMEKDIAWIKARLSGAPVAQPQPSTPEQQPLLPESCMTEDR